VPINCTRQCQLYMCVRNTTEEKTESRNCVFGRELIRYCTRVNRRVLVRLRLFIICHQTNSTSRPYDSLTIEMSQDAKSQKQNKEKAIPDCRLCLIYSVFPPFLFGSSGFRPNQTLMAMLFYTSTLKIRCLQS
jgi:hypothetical protein